MCYNVLPWLTFSCFALSRQERSPLVPLGKQDTLCIFAAHFAKVPPGEGETVRMFSGSSLVTCSAAISANQRKGALLLHNHGCIESRVIEPLHNGHNGTVYT